MRLFLLVFFLHAALFVEAQQVDINQIRLKIYDTILQDVQNQNIELPFKKIVLDPTINKFEDYKMDEFGLKLDSVKYEQDLSFCNKLSAYKCSTKFEIDQYSITNIYKNEADELYPDFYGIYSPIDTWYNLIYYAAVNHFQKNKKFQFNILIPVRNVQMKNRVMNEKMIFYNFLFDEQFKVLKFEKLFLKH
ncbi:hypothetical protein [Empedobacter brevis]|uniref:hypothetical protein n=1 Tax=Empedobacter brevis TaxID=247 RepID=UPI0039AF0EB2